MKINPINQLQNLNYRQKQINQKKYGNESFKDSDDLKIAGSYKSYAITSPNFRSQSAPVEITHLYNKKTEAKDHLDLPNISIYEFPDTNLRVMIDKNKNMSNLSMIEGRLYVKDDIKSGSLIKKEICKKMISEIIERELPSSKYENNLQGFYTISFNTEKSNNDLFKDLNRILFNPKFEIKDLERQKQDLIEYINKFDNNDISLILQPKTNLKSKEECINEIKQIDIDSIQDYYNNKIKNSSVMYFITLNENNYNEKFLNNLNKNVNIKFQNHKLDKNNYSMLLNKESAIFIKDKNTDGFRFEFPYNGKTLKDDFVAIFSTLLLIFLAQPYIKEDSDISSTRTSILSKDPGLLSKYHIINFDFLESDFINLSPNQALSLQKEIVKKVNETDYSVTLEDIKNVFKERFLNEITLNYEVDKNNKYLYEYGEDIYNLYEVIDSISAQDVKDHIEHFIINQEPVVRYS